ncbi:PIN domain-containing protein [Hydrogenimonas sp.]
MEKVVFDTNFIRNTEAKHFLGGRSELEKFAKVAELVFPDIVIEEIKNQKRKNLEKSKSSFLSNPFHWLCNLDRDDTKNFDIESHISDLEANETLQYSVIKLTDYSVLEQMKELALKKLPPFEAGDNTDKGFKDACIYFTTLEYLQSIPDKMIFVCCKDGRLKEAFEKHPNIIVIESYDDFIQNSITRFYDDYFIEKLQSEVHADISKEHIVNFWININENRVLLVEVDGEKYAVEVDSGEIVAFEKVAAYSDAINKFIHSGAFATTHAAIEALNPYIHFISDGQILKILEAVDTNNQIYLIIGDEDVKQFVSTLYDGKKELLPTELAANIKKRLEE